MSRGGILIPVLGLLALFFGWKCYEAWTSPYSTAAPAAAGGIDISSIPPPPGQPAALDMTAAVSAIAARPVFRSDRQPFREGTPAASRRNYESEISRFSVVGVLFMDGAPKAIVTGAGAGKSERYEVGAGDSLPGFAVKEVRPDGVLVTADDKEFTIPLYAGSPKGATGALRTEPSPQKAATGQASTPEASAPARSQPAQTSSQPQAPARVQPAPARVQPLPAPVQQPAPGANDGAVPGGATRQRPVYGPGRR